MGDGFHRRWACRTTPVVMSARLHEDLGQIACLLGMSNELLPHKDDFLSSIPKLKVNSRPGIDHYFSDSGPRPIPPVFCPSVQYDRQQKVIILKCYYEYH